MLKLKQLQGLEFGRWEIVMATKSILKNINIKEKNMGRNFVTALEHAKDKPCKEVVITKSCSVLTSDQIRVVFGDKR